MEALSRAPKQAPRRCRWAARPALGALALALGLSAAVSSCGELASRSPTPRLIVLVVVDQLPQYLLERYDPHFTGGFRRLLDEGRVFARAFHDHARTSTAPGYTTVATGVYPYRHGIVGNGWIERASDRLVQVASFQDSTETIVGLPSVSGFSPRMLEVTALGDWLADADPEARMFSISGKVRAAVPLAGHGRGHVWVFDDDYGPAFVTSTYYRDQVPDWVRRFNDGGFGGLIADSVWESTVPSDALWASRRDTAEYERGGEHEAFPHTYEAESDSNDRIEDWFEGTPMLDEASVGLAMEAVVALQLGQRQSTDLLALALSATDRVGHTYGPFSREQLDNLLRLDRALGELFSQLDRIVGSERYVVALSSDHGVLPIPEYLGESAEPEVGDEGGRVSRGYIGRILRAIDSVGAASTAERNERRATILESFDLVEQAWTVEELLAPEPSDTFALLYRRSYRPDRLTGLAPRGVVVRLRERYMAGGAAATHGSPYLYDRHVPIVLMGAGIEPGWDEERASTVDIAPTLARLAGVPYPENLDGRPLIAESHGGYLRRSGAR